MTNAVPNRSLAQRLDALAHANEVRCGKAALKRELKAEAIRPIAALDDPRSASFKLDEFLRAVPGLGRVKAAKLANPVQVSPSKRIGALSARQKQTLRDALDARQEATR